MERDTLHRAADELTILLKAHVSDSAEEVDVMSAMAARDDLREMAYDMSDEIEHTCRVGDILIDDYEPTPSPEANTVEIVELIDERADEFVVEETGKTVAEHDNNQYYPDDDPVVAAVYPNMGADKVWHFPESRLR